MLAQGFSPAKRFKDRPNQIVFCLAFIRFFGNWEAVEMTTNALTKLVKINIAKCVPLRNVLNGFG